MPFYAVKAGHAPGIYQTWDACKAQVHGYKGAVYKKFDTRAEAERFVAEESDAPETVDLDAIAEDAVVCYVDGSFNADTKTFGYGVVYFTADGKQTFHGCDKGADASHRNVAGEIFGSMFAMQHAIEEGKKKMQIHYDYAGIRHWALGEWKRNYDLTKRYHAYYESIKDALAVTFVKVKAHTGDTYNEEADALAKQGCGIVEKKSE